jgi:hypothetical protein
LTISLTVTSSEPQPKRVFGYRHDDQASPV